MIAISRTLMLQKPAVDIAARIISVSTGPSKMEDLISKEEEERDVSSAFNMVPEIFTVTPVRKWVPCTVPRSIRVYPC